MLLLIGCLSALSGEKALTTFVTNALKLAERQGTYMPPYTTFNIFKEIKLYKSFVYIGLLVMVGGLKRRQEHDKFPFCKSSSTSLPVELEGRNPVKPAPELSAAVSNFTV